MKATPILAITAALLFTAPLARAEDPEVLAAARSAFIDAAAQGRQGNWAEACKLYAKSLELHRAAITLYSLGIAQREAGHLLDAQASLQAFLAEPVTLKTKGFVLTAREALTDIEHRLAHVSIQLEPKELVQPTVEIDGTPIDPSKLSMPQTLDPGAHRIVAHAKDRLDASTEITLPDGGTASVSLRLPPEVVAPPVIPPPPLPVAEKSAPLIPIAPPPPQAPSRALPFSLLGGGAAVLGAGITVGLIGVSESGNAATSSNSQASDARTKALVGDLLSATGGTAVVAGLIVLLARPSARSVPSRTVTPWIGSHSAGLQIAF